MMQSPSFWLGALLLLASSGRGPEAAKIVVIERVPHVVQKPDFCGEACAEMYLRKLGVSFDQDRIFDRSGLDPSLGRGLWTRELKPTLESLGFEVGKVYREVSAANAAEELDREWRGMLDDLRRGVPSIVCMHYDDRPKTTEHFRLVLGYDGPNDEVIFHDPAGADGAYAHMDRSKFLALWPLKYHADRWTVIRLALDAKKKIADAPKPEGLTRADFAQHVIALKERLPAGFHVVVEPPFVVIGDESKEVVRRRAEHTVRWSVDKLKLDYFDATPNKIIDVWLLKDKASYEQAARRMTGETPDTPYGFYLPRINAMIMNIQPGAGTLVHEIVHPFVEADFPDCPAWLNEGLGSLYEYPGERNGHIFGHTNWRLPALQRAIRDRTAPSLDHLISTTTDEFYGDDSGLHYAEARYLLYWLQEHDLLVEFYRGFRADHAKDPSGYRSLLRTIGEPDLSKFEPRWRRFVLGLVKD
jgi:peptidase C39-like protein